MDGKVKGVLVASALAALAGGGAALAGATGGGDDDGSERPISGRALERAGAAALEHTGGGRVRATEVNDEEGKYEVEVVRRDGSQVDVHLDGDFHVIGDQADDDGRADED